MRIDQIFDGGGAVRIAFMQYCVMSVTMEPLFVFLCREYRLRPGHSGALALYDVFCAPGAPARIDAVSVLPPRNPALTMTIASIRRQWQQMQQLEPPAPETTLPITVPMHGLFDNIAEYLSSDPGGTIARLAGRYDPSLSPWQNLPGQRMTAAQNHFVENVWKPVVRARLVAAGFWRVETIE